MHTCSNCERRLTSIFSFVDRNLTLCTLLTISTEIWYCPRPIDAGRGARGRLYIGLSLTSCLYRAQPCQMSRSPIYRGLCADCRLSTDVLASQIAASPKLSSFSRLTYHPRPLQKWILDTWTVMCLPPRYFPISLLAAGLELLSVSVGWHPLPQSWSLSSFAPRATHNTQTPYTYITPPHQYQNRN